MTRAILILLALVGGIVPTQSIAGPPGSAPLEEPITWEHCEENVLCMVGYPIKIRRQVYIGPVQAPWQYTVELMLVCPRAIPEAWTRRPLSDPNWPEYTYHPDCTRAVGQHFNLHDAMQLAIGYAWEMSQFGEKQ